VTEERDCTVLGMDLNIGVNDPIATAQPLAAFIVVKVLRANGQEDYLTAATAGLHPVECLGMADFAVQKLGHVLKRRWGW
jgi:hypothetical protein